ncbi:uncharacterized protein si:ch211-170d8.2 [Carassius auratus]|uniref:Uncharacterized protein si:ch211-170d8.2 n=1 Tax=Carassius auratus TaxID=7957 RepID=A0A6P6P219_CARAU|nr:uncharacterized protein LOC113093772 [Carassius auratus]
MSETEYMWITLIEMANVTRALASLLFFLAFMTIAIGVHCRSLRTQLRKVTSFQGERKIRTGHVQRRGRREPGPEPDQCTLLSAPWTESTTPLGDWGQMYRLMILSTMSDGPRRAVFPEQPLFRFVRRVYRCCKVGYHCGSVKGIQGGKVGDYNIEFLLGEDVLSATLVKAEVHFHFSNPQHLTIQPLLPSLEKRGFPTRYSVWLRDGVVELRVDLLVLFQALQLVIGGAIKGPSLMEMHRVRDLIRPGFVVQKQRPPSPQDTVSVVWGEENEGREGAAPLQPALELGLALRCSLLDNIALPCQDYCVHLEHAPFIALTYT